MMKFFLDKLRDRPGPLKQLRLVVGDIIEEVLDIASHYIQRRREDGTDLSPPGSHTTEPSREQHSDRSGTPRHQRPVGTPKKKSAHVGEAALSEVELPPELILAVQIPANRKKQEFKVLAILWDANQRNMGELTAMDVADHGIKLGLVIRHENVRKVIRMQLSGFVESVQNRKKGTAIQQYRITPKGIGYFEQKYLTPPL